MKIMVVLLNIGNIINYCLNFLKNLPKIKPALSIDGSDSSTMVDLRVPFEVSFIGPFFNPNAKKDGHHNNQKNPQNRENCCKNNNEPMKFQIFFGGKIG